MLGTQLSSAKPLHDSQRQQGPDWLVQVDHTKCRNSHFLIRAKGRSHAAWRCPGRRDAAMINLYMVFTADQVIGKRAGCKTHVLLLPRSVRPRLEQWVDRPPQTGICRALAKATLGLYYHPIAVLIHRLEIDVRNFWGRPGRRSGRLGT